MAGVVYNTAVAESAERSIELLFTPYLAPSQATRKPFTETDVRQISDGLRRMGKDSWSRVPRLYTILRMVNQVQVIDSFVAQGVSDIWFPFSLQTLPEDLRSDSSRFAFLEAQDLVLTKAFDLEREDGKHRHFSKAEDVPMRKIEELGKGGFGCVDRVVSTITYKEYARKLILRGRTFKKNIEVLKNFERELGHLKKLSHIHIVKFIGSYTDPKYVGIIMSPVAECNLGDFLARDPLPSETRSSLRPFFGCLATALCYLHDNKLRHKDIKPQNILIKDGQIFLTDFGISLDWSELDQSTTTGVTIKTPRYCAPEVAQSMPRNTLSDLWSLGCVFLEIWTALKGSSIATLFEYLNNHGSKSPYYHLNRDSSLAWCRNLEAEARPEENPPLPWIVGLLQPDQDQRWTARKLFDQIQEVNEDPDNRFTFSGPCCVSDDDSTQSAGSSKRSSRNLEETGASSMGVYCDARTNQNAANEKAPAKDLSSSQTVRPSEMNAFSTKHLEYNTAPLPSKSDAEARSPPMRQIKTLEHTETLQNAPILADDTSTGACSQIPMSKDTASQSSVSSITMAAAEGPSSEHVQIHGYATMLPVQEQATEPSQLNEDERRQEPDGRAFHAEALREISEVDKTIAKAMAHEEREQTAAGVESLSPTLEVRKRKLDKYTPSIPHEHTAAPNNHVSATRRASTSQASVVPKDARSSSALATSFQNQFDTQIGTTGPPPVHHKSLNVGEQDADGKTRQELAFDDGKRMTLADIRHIIVAEPAKGARRYSTWRKDAQSIPPQPQSLALKRKPVGTKRSSSIPTISSFPGSASTSSLSPPASDRDSEGMPSLTYSSGGVHVTEERPSLDQPSLTSSSKPMPEQQRLRKRRHVIKELIDTEFMFGRDMRVVIDIYKVTSDSCLMVTADDLKILFGNIDQVARFSLEFLGSLKKAGKAIYVMPRPERFLNKMEGQQETRSLAVESAITATPFDQSSIMEPEAPDADNDYQTSIGDVFKSHMAEMEEVYTRYIRNHDNANKKLQSLQQTQDVKIWLESCHSYSKDLTSACNLDSLLVKPVLRILEYPLFLQQLIESTRGDHPDYSSLLESLQELTRVSMEINEKVKQSNLVKLSLDSKAQRFGHSHRSVQGLWASFTRKQQASISEMIEDKVYNDLKDRYIDNYNQLVVVGSDITKYMATVTKWVERLSDFAAAADGWVDVHYSPWLELESKLRQFATTVREVATHALPGHLAAIQKSVIDPIFRSATMLEGLQKDPKGLFQMRHKKLIDYARYSNMRDRGKKLDRNITERIEQWEALDREAKERMEKLILLTAELVCGCLRTFIQIHLGWLDMWKRRLPSTMNVTEAEIAQIEKDWRQDYDFQEASALSMSICNGSLLAEAVNMVNFLSPSTTMNVSEVDNA